MEWLVILPALSEVGRLYLSAFSSLTMSLKTPWIVYVDAWRCQAYSLKVLSSSEIMLVFAEKEKCHSQVSLCPGPSSLSPDMQHSLGRSWQLQKTNLESQDSFLG